MDDPKQNIVNNSPQTKLVTGSLSLFDINILPDRHRRRKLYLINILPWLVFLLLLGALYPTSMAVMQAQSYFQHKKSELVRVQSLLDNYQNAEVELDALQSDIEFQTERRDQILSSYEGLDIKGSNWSTTLYRIIETVPDGIFLTQITQNDGQINFDGIANSYSAVLRLKDALETLDELLIVQIESVDQISGDPPESPPASAGDENQPINDQTHSYNFSLLAIVGEEGQQ
jgi:Tfp pilus assembly protein PilN